MSVFDFLKKKDSSAIAPPMPPSGVSPISKNDERLSPTLPPAPKPPAGVSALPPPPSSLPPRSSVANLPPIASLPSTSATLPPLPQAPKAPAPPSLPPLAAPATPAAPRAPTPSLPPLAAPMAAAPRPPVPVALPTLAPAAPRPLPPMPVAPTLPPRPVSLTLDERPVIGSPMSVSAPVQPAPVSKGPMPQAVPAISSRPAPAATGQVPIQELRKVIQELRNIPLDMPAPAATPKPAAPVAAKPAAPAAVAPAPVAPKARHAFIPVQRFDEGILAIRAMHTSLSTVQAGNEKVGNYEAQAKAAADGLAAACDAIQTTLLSIDGKLFQVN